MSGPPPGQGPPRSMSVANVPPAGVPPHSAMPPAPSSVTSSTSAQSGPQSQQNLNQIVSDGVFNAPVNARGSSSTIHEIVLEYLSKKGYVRTEAMLRKESEPLTAPAATNSASAQATDFGGTKYTKAFDLLRKYHDDNLEIYQPELRKLLWPIFVYSFLALVREYFTKDAEAFFASYKSLFEREHEEDIKMLSPIRLPTHVRESRIATMYMENRYRLTLTMMPFYNLIQFLESKMFEGGSTIQDMLREHLNIVTIERAAMAEKSIASILAGGHGDDDLPTEDEGIPGHAPGHPLTHRHDPDADASRVKLQLGPYPQDQELQEDVRATLQEEDSRNLPRPGQNSLVDEYDQRIKREPTDDVPSRDLVPLPPSLARDVSMEVQKVIEHRDRYKMEGRTGGVGPAASVTMFTFHNTYDSINCIDFSGDNKLVAAGMAESYIRVWSLDGSPLSSMVPDTVSQLSSSRRLVGHSGAVYAVSFSPSTVNPDSTGPPTESQYLLSCSEDSTIRLWSLETWTCLVAYRGHNSPVWDVQWGPLGHYFLTGSNDRTARLWATDHIESLRMYVGHDNDVDCVAFHPNNLYCFTGSCDKTVRMWHVSGGNCLRLFTGHPGHVTSLACSPDGKTLASADDTGTIMLWNLESGRRKKRMRGHGKGGIWSLSWSVESTVLVSAGADKTVRVWDALQETTESTFKTADGATGKADGAFTTKGASGTSGTTKKAAKESGVSADQISAFPTKDSPVYKAIFTRMNLVLAGGAYMPPKA